MTIEEFQKVELKIGRVVTAKRVEGSEKLLRLEVDLGGPDPEHPEVRQVISGIAKSYAPEDLLQKEIVMVANLDPREVMGFTSQGMILCARDADGKPVTLTVEREVAPGTEIT